MNITILGAGAWGTALALSLTGRHQVVLWGRNQTLIRDINLSREHQGFHLPESLALSSDLSDALAHSSAPHSLLIVATSVSGLRPLAQILSTFSIPNLVWLCKGLEENSLQLPHQIVQQELGDRLPCGALSGPSFAQEVAKGQPCALTIASHFPELSDLVVDAIHGPAIRVYSTDDLIGVEVGGAVKNILAIATGIADGMGLGLNARAALITRGLAEITRLGLALGGRTETFMGLTGMGDLILTCTGDLSRNRRVGLALAQGKPLAQIVQDLGHVAEGVRCAQAVQLLSRQLKVDMPISNAVADVLFKGDSPVQMVQNLLARDAKPESK
ncbi:glycerol-3-phosphate dehydrogenase (NAD(P)+) [Oxalobacteraceae bacterium GrIS 2.11]